MPDFIEVHKRVDFANIAGIVPAIGDTFWSTNTLYIETIAYGVQLTTNPAKFQLVTNKNYCNRYDKNCDEYCDVVADYIEAFFVPFDTAACVSTF
ncbi:hypothetical protein BpHYR1_024919 [Brachionus plicatilis]|uniref:Uncharacterized protein n=1 Tax=Brachionus plicatilis TaxID=10195 RepID=A0A3M7RZ16_BRAPC|nr:hypothetical protein BpHYR1_024919 [Brachionus plicatilis]